MRKRNPLRVAAVVLSDFADTVVVCSATKWSDPSKTPHSTRSALGYHTPPIFLRASPQPFRRRLRETRLQSSRPHLRVCRRQ